MDAIITAMETAVTEIANNCSDMIASILPLALPVLGVVIAVTFGLKFIKKVMK